MNVVVQSVQEDTCQHFACNAKERDSAVIITASMVSFVLVNMQKECILEVLWDRFFLPDLTN